MSLYHDTDAHKAQEEIAAAEVERLSNATPRKCDWKFVAVVVGLLILAYLVAYRSS